jgi:sugar O-acyltransferase (sialic acid O-acetyltransferase NeuD family)
MKPHPIDQHEEMTDLPNPVPKAAAAGKATGKSLLVFGGSGHAKDVIETAAALGYQRFTLVTSDGSSSLHGLKALKEADFDPNDYMDWDCIVAIGNNAHRKRFFDTYSSLRQVSIISPSALISPSSRIGKGSYIGAFAYIGPDSILAEACIVNTHSIIGHDSTVGAYSQIGPKVCISGNVHVGESVFVGAGVVFNNGSLESPLLVPDQVHIGMGCHITASIRHKGLRILPRPNHIGVNC